MIVDPKIKGYDFSQLNEIVTGVEIKNIYDYYKNLSTIKEALGELDDKNYGYLYAPLKEPYFEIDANTRAIKVPDLFRTNGIGVQGDNLAETICFSINRYFDTMDLAHTRVYINWTLNDGEESAKEEAFFIDPVAKADYLIIGWPLDGKKFVNVGKLKFYLTFELIEAGVVKYRLNTLSAEVKINATLAMNEDITTINKEEYEGSYGILFNNSDPYTKYEIGTTPTIELEEDLQPYTTEKFVANYTGPHKELITGTNMVIAAKFKIPTDVTATVTLYKDREPQDGVYTPDAQGICTATISTAGTYYFEAVPKQTIPGAGDQLGNAIKTSTIGFMTAMTPKYTINYTNHLPTAVSVVKDKQVIYMPDSEDCAEVKITIDELDYSADKSGFAHTQADFGKFSLVFSSLLIDGETVTYEPLVFTNKELVLTKEDLTHIKTVLDDRGTVKLEHQLNNTTATIINPFENYSFVTTAVEPYVITSPSQLGKIILGKDRNFFTLSKGNFNLNTETYTEKAIWQKSQTNSNGRVTWTTEFYQEDPILITLPGFNSETTYYKKNKDAIVTAVKNNYRICLERTDGYTITTSTVSPTHNYDQFYTIDVDAVISEDLQG